MKNQSVQIIKGNSQKVRMNFDNKHRKSENRREYNFSNQKSFGNVKKH